MEITKAYRYVLTLRKLRSGSLNLDATLLFKDKMMNLSYLVLDLHLVFISKIKAINKLIKECQKLVKHQIAVT